MLATSASGADLRVDGRVVAREAFYHGSHQLSLGRGDVRRIDGDLLISRGRTGFRVIARIPIEDYVAAALESEAREFHAPEALKAMAVAVRTYAASNRHRHGATADLCDGTHCQRLKFPITERMREAARATNAELVLYQNKPAHVFYHQNCGGVTASAANVWGGGGLPYLVSRRDPYCERRPSSWRAEVTKASLRRVLASPEAPPGLPSNEALHLDVLGHSASGRVSAVRVGTHSWSGTQFRDLLSGMTGQGLIRSGRFQIVEAADHFTFIGNGAGHGVGLCQHGTVARAEAGDNYHQILAAYFPGTRIGIQ